MRHCRWEPSVKEEAVCKWRGEDHASHAYARLEARPICPRVAGTLRVAGTWLFHLKLSGLRCSCTVHWIWHGYWHLPCVGHVDLLLVPASELP